MKQLLLIRHAKSDWDFPARSDHDRPLNERGTRDAPIMANALAERGIVPDAVVTSTAIRASTTAGIVAKGLGFPAASIVEVPELYLASPQTILETLQELDESCGTVLLFGHNPGIHEAAEWIAAGANLEGFPTLAVARIELDVARWEELEPGSGLLIELLTPRNAADPS